MSNITPLKQFLDSSPTSFHAVENIKSALLKNGFHELKNGLKWSLKPSFKYFIQEEGSIIAFTIPKGDLKEILLLGSHTDSPALKLKPNPETIKEGMVTLSSEVYGGPLLSSWLNRDLGIAGKIVYEKSKNKLEETLVDTPFAVATIPQLAIHLDRKVNDEGLILNKQEHLNALTMSKKGKLPFLNELFDKKIVSHDLFLYPKEPAALIGKNQEFLASYRIDSLASVFAILTAYLKETSASKNTLKMIAFFDHEEIGSSTETGAASPFFSHTLERITLALKLSREDFLCLIKNSNSLSVDLGHAVHPNYPEKHDKEHKPTLGAGIQLKTSASKKYATSAKSSKIVLEAAKLKKIPIHIMAARNDIPCGTTIGPIQATLTGIPTVDIGISQLSMHSTRELIAIKDFEYLIELLKEILKKILVEK